MNRLRELEHLLKQAIISKDENLAITITRGLIDMGASVSENDDPPYSQNELSYNPRETYRGLTDQQTIFDSILSVTDNFELAFKLAVECKSVAEAMNRINMNGSVSQS